MLVGTLRETAFLASTCTLTKILPPTSLYYKLPLVRNLVTRHNVQDTCVEHMMNISNHTDVTSDYTKAPTSSIRARMIPTDSSSLYHAGMRLQSGHLVSFPTETVYGLGCHALDSSAIQRVFKAKERPLTDPLIVHICQLDDAWPLWKINSYEIRAIRALAHSFWPGPLTLIARASSIVPSILTADTGYVACRCPAHLVARELIRCAGVPVAAPSANKFGHVSPTNARHVWDDLFQEDVWILDPELAVKECEDNNDIEDKKDEEHSRCCRVGVESTVVKVHTRVESDNDDNRATVDGTVHILRKGSVSKLEVRQCLHDAGLLKYNGKTDNNWIEQQKHTHDAIFTVGNDVRCTKTDLQNVAPGQSIRHYSPYVESCTIVSHCRQYSDMNASHNHMNYDAWDHGEKEVLSKSVVIDYGRRLRMMEPYALAYRDLSPDNDSSEAASVIFEVLRWSESVYGASRVYVPEIYIESEHSDKEKDNALLEAIKDRLTRAASGIIVDKLI